MGKRVLNNDTSRRYPVYGLPRLLLRFATGTTMWVSSAAASTQILALQPHPSGNDVLRRWQSVSPLSFLVRHPLTTLTLLEVCYPTSERHTRLDTLH